MQLSKLQRYTLMCMGKRHKEGDHLEPISLTALMSYVSAHYDKALNASNYRASLKRLVERKCITLQLNEWTKNPSFVITQEGLVIAETLLLEERMINVSGPDVFWS